MDQGRPMRVAVNLAMRNLLDADLPVDVADLLKLNGVSADLLDRYRERRDLRPAED